MKAKNTKYIIAFLCMLAVLTVFFIYWGNGKRITFCDEVYTYNIVNSRSLIQYTVNEWMTGNDFNDAFTQGNQDSFFNMIRNIKGDMVHPPLYYVFMYISSIIAGSDMSVWTGLAVNLLGYLGTAVIMFLILKKLFDNPLISALGSIALMCTQCMISDAMLIRMYMVYTFFATLLAYVSILLAENKSIRNYILLGITIVGGFLTQYYFVFFVASFFFFELIHNIKSKKYKEIIKYIVTIMVAFTAITLLWYLWFWAITSNTHSSGVIGNAKELLLHLNKVYISYELVMAAIFQRAYKFFMVIIPLLVIAFLIIVSGEEGSLIRVCVVRLGGTAFIYAFIVNVLTPDYLSSNRYYYACMMLALAGLIICVFGIADTIVKTTGLRKNLVLSVMGVSIIILNITLLATGSGIDYYYDKDDYDEITDILESYSNLPWILSWENSWMIDTSMQDYIIPDRIIPLNSNAEVEEGTFDGIEEFILVEYRDDASPMTTRKNLYGYITTVGKEVTTEKIASRIYVDYYYCHAVDSDKEEQQRLEEFITGSRQLLWIVVNDDGWYNAEDMFPEGEPENIIFIDAKTPYDTSGKFNDCNEAVIIRSSFGDEVQDVALYYLIGSTGRFYGADYMGNTNKCKVAVYRCNVIE